MDTDKDRLVSYSEFMAATKREEFLEKEEWEVSLTLRFYSAEASVKADAS